MQFLSFLVVNDIFLSELIYSNCKNTNIIRCWTSQARVKWENDMFSIIICNVLTDMVLEYF